LGEESPACHAGTAGRFHPHHHPSQTFLMVCYG